VIAAARGSGRDVTIAARSDPDAVRAWAAERSDLAGIRVVAGLGEAMQTQAKPVAAIVASRPRDHVRDVDEALRLNLDVLVEKPIGVDAQGGRYLLNASKEVKRVLAVGTEFAYLPALRQLANEISTRRSGPVRFMLKWDDIAGEVRHGSVKARHEEVGLLTDLLPHAFSIFETFAPGAAWRIVDADESRGGSRGRIEFADDAGGRYDFLCDVAAAGRQRVLRIESNAVNATLDFGEAAPSIRIDGRRCAPDPRHATMTSTLRLELGAFLAAVTGAIDETFIVSELATLLTLQEQLEQKLANEAGRSHE
jgi:predicted dehydrogenase